MKEHVRDMKPWDRPVTLVSVTGRSSYTFKDAIALEDGLLRGQTGFYSSRVAIACRSSPARICLKLTSHLGSSIFLSALRTAITTVFPSVCSGLFFKKEKRIVNHEMEKIGTGFLRLRSK